MPFENLVLYPQQSVVRRHKKGPLAFVGGIGSGKSIAGAHFSLQQIYDNPHIPGLIFTNTNKQLYLATLTRFMEVLAFYGIHRDQQFVIDKNPFPFFGYESLFPKHEGVWSFSNGAQIITFSLESAMRGIEVGWAWGDEIQDATQSGMDIVLGRVRRKGEPIKIVYTLTPPRFNPYIDNLIYGENHIPTVHASTYDNRHNLPEGYIEMLEQMYDPLTFQREVMGQQVQTTGKAYAYAFSRERHVSDRAVYNPNRVIILVFDFNKDPFVCLAVQHGRTKEGTPFIHVVDEISLPDADIYQMCEAVKVKFPENIFKKSIEISGDPTGRNRNIYDKKNRNAYQIIIDELHLGKGYLHIPAITSNQDDRVLFNSILDRHPEILINPRCKNFIRDLQFVRVDNYGEIIKRNRKDETQQADLLDAGKYYFQAYHADFIKRKGYAKPVPVVPLPVHTSLKDLNLS